MMRYFLKWGVWIFLSGFLLIMSFYIEHTCKQYVLLKKANHYLHQQLKNVMINQKSSLLSVPLAKLPAQTELLEDLARHIAKTGFTMQNLQIMPMQKMNAMAFLPVKLIVFGSTTQLTDMLTGLLQYSSTHRPAFSIAINDFSLITNANQQAWVALNLLIFSTPISSTIENHFQASFLWESASLNTMKLVGYMQDAQHFWSLIMLPTGQTRAVQLGSMLGVEKGRVVSLNPDEIVVSLGSRQVFIRH